MSFISKLTSKATRVIPQQLSLKEPLPNRIIGKGGFMQMGATFHEPRTNSAQEIYDSITLLAKNEQTKSKNITSDLIEYAKEALGIDLEKEAKNSTIFDTAMSIFQSYAEKFKNLGRRFTPEEQKLVDKINRFKTLGVNAKIAELKSNEIQEFLANAADMPQRHLSLAQDIIDLSRTQAFINDEIFPSVNFNTVGVVNSTNKQTTMMGYLLNLLPKMSKENPKALDVAEAVVTHTDDANSKFFISRFLEKAPNTPEQTELTEKLIPRLAEGTLNGMPSMDLGPNCKENVFLRLVSHLCSNDSKPENLKLLDKLLDMVDKISKKTTPDINLDDIRLGDTKIIRENMEAMPYLLENAEALGKNVDASGFLTKNVNLK